MSKSNTWETGLLNLLFNNTPFTLVGDAAGLLASAGEGSLYVSLHTADPGEAGTQQTNECAYGSYARQAVARNSGGWAISGDTVSNVGAINFPQATSGSEIATHYGIGTSSSGAGKLLYSAALDASLAISNGVTPQFGIGALSGTEA